MPLVIVPCSLLVVNTMYAVIVFHFDLTFGIATGFSSLIKLTPVYSFVPKTLNSWIEYVSIILSPEGVVVFNCA